jgi:hypothetical protein
VAGSFQSGDEPRFHDISRTKSSRNPLTSLISIQLLVLGTMIAFAHAVVCIPRCGDDARKNRQRDGFSIVFPPSWVCLVMSMTAQTNP